MNKKENNPEQYIIVPTALLQADISPNSKLLYGLILSLSRSNKFDFGELGVCYANNKYLARNLGVTKATIQKSISELVYKGYLERHMNQDRPNQTRRHLTPTTQGWDMKFISSEQIWAENEAKLDELEKRQMIEQEYASNNDLNDNTDYESPF